MDADLDTLATALYVTVDDLLQQAPQLAPWRPPVGIPPKRQRRRAGHLGGHAGPARLHLRGPLAALCRPAPAPPVPVSARPVGLQQAAAGAPPSCMGHLYPGRGLRHHAVERRCVGGGLHPGGVRPLPGDHQDARRWPGGPQYGYCASHSRYFWGLRLHLVCTLHGLPVAAALTGAKADGAPSPAGPAGGRAGAGGGPAGTGPAGRQALLRPPVRGGCSVELGVRLLRPARKGEPQRAGSQLFRPLRQLIESVNQTFKGQLDLERHGGQHPCRGRSPGPAAHPGPHRCDLAQRQDWTADPAVAGRL